MGDVLTISTTVQSGPWKAEVTYGEDWVDFDMVFLIDGEETDSVIGAHISSKFAKELGRALENAGYATAPEDD